MAEGFKVGRRTLDLWGLDNVKGCGRRSFQSKKNRMKHKNGHAHHVHQGVQFSSEREGKNLELAS